MSQETETQVTEETFEAYVRGVYGELMEQTKAVFGTTWLGYLNDHESISELVMNEGGSEETAAFASFFHGLTDYLIRSDQARA